MQRECSGNKFVHCFPEIVYEQVTRDTKDGVRHVGVNWNRASNTGRVQEERGCQAAGTGTRKSGGPNMLNTTLLTLCIQVEEAYLRLAHRLSESLLTTRLQTKRTGVLFVSPQIKGHTSDEWKHTGSGIYDAGQNWTSDVAFMLRCRK